MNARLAGIGALIVLFSGCSAASSGAGDPGSGAGGGSGAKPNLGGAGSGLGKDSGAKPGTGGGGSASGGGSGGGTSSGGSGGGLVIDGSTGSGGSSSGGGDPKTCKEAADAKTYIGCDFWPTVTTNYVWSLFDFAVVVANTQDVAADVVIERAGTQIAVGQVPPNGLEKFYLPWIAELKGPDFDTCGFVANPISSSLRAPSGAYHLTTSVPVTVYQFNALEYAGTGGPSGKNWSSCPGSQPCPNYFQPMGCYSFSNDASLLLPSTALTQNYRVTMMSGWADAGGIPANVPAYFAVTGTKDNTTVTVQVAAKGQVVAGNQVPAAAGGQLTTFTLNRGDVVEVVGTPTTDLAGSLVQATAPVQVIAGMPCVYLPFNQPACDHIEESVLPAETLGQRYFVVPPTGPKGDAPGHLVRLVGNFDGTKLSYPGGTPTGAPTMINAGQVVELGIVKQAFEISGDHEFAIVTFGLGASVVDPLTPAPSQKGDPDQSNMIAVEQYRKKYVFLAPEDYDVSFVDIVMPSGATIKLDGAAIGVAPVPISSGYSIARVSLSKSGSGVHRLESDQPIGIQVQGYGSYTSYQYPGGLNLELIAPPPPSIK